jgi:DNA-binding MarR family transcriptional regulator
MRRAPPCFFGQRGASTIMTKAKVHVRSSRISPSAKTRQKDTAATEEAFPPLSTSLESFVKAGSDREFRKLIYDLLSLSNLMLRNRKHFAAYIDVTDAQQVMMQMIAETHGMTIGRIAKQLHVTSQFVGIEIRELIKKNIVEKQPNEADRRSMFLNLTSKGQSLLREMAPLRRRTNDTMFRSLTEDRARLLQEIIGPLIADGRSALHDLEAPHLHSRRAPSAQSETKASIGADLSIGSDRSAK